jgi:signal transduction histidine kinase
VDFVGLAWGAGETVAYEYRLEGADDDWGPTTPERRVNFASLAPGRYRFAVRAVSASGLRSPEPAVVSFRVLAPFWRRGWFLALVAAGLAAAGFAFARLRDKRILALEGVRARIAADLHDDIGSSLSRISILSEVARRKAGEGEAAAMLGEIAETARALVGSMSDAVWSIDPAQDDLRNVVTRMRTFATDVLDGKGISWTFDAPRELDARLAPETRRELFLVFKEAVTNVARHSGAKSARLRLELLAGSLTLEVADDGKGFDTGPARDLDSSLQRGRGLVNMQVRAKRMGGSLTLVAEPGRGARLVLVLPIAAGRA